MLVPVRNGDTYAYAQVNEADYAQVTQREWHWKGGYAVSGKGQLPMHRMLLRPPADMEVDHIDRNKLNNQRSNLRIVTHHTNSQNLPVRADSNTGIRGVCYDKERGKWRAHIRVNGKRIYARFNTKEEAAAAAVAMRKEHMPDAPD